MELFFGEFLPLDEHTPRRLRSRIAYFAPLLGEATEAIRLAASEIATAFVRFGRAKGFTVRLFTGEDRFRIEMVDGLVSEQYLTSPEDFEGQSRHAVMDGATDRWGVLSNGKSVVWFEVLRSGSPTSGTMPAASGG